jgi:hypothetical protein
MKSISKTEVHSWLLKWSHRLGVAPQGAQAMLQLLQLYNCLLYGLQDHLIKKLQRVQNAAAGI